MIKQISKKKIIILVVLMVVLIGTLVTSFYLKISENKYKTDYVISYNIDSLIDKDVIFSAIASSNLKSIDRKYDYSSILPKDSYINVYNKSVIDTKKEIEEFFEVENDLFKNLNGTDNVSYSYFTLFEDFPSQFEMVDNYFGLVVNSEAANSSVIKVNYYNNASDYSVSLFSNNGDELIYMKSPEIYNMSYLEAFNSFVFKFISNNEEIRFGDDLSDSALFPVVNVIIDNEISNEEVSNYVLGARINISGTGEFNGKSFSLDKNNIKYKFDSDSILFIRKVGNENPYLIIPLH